MAKKKFHILIRKEFCKACAVCYSYCPTKAIGPDKNFQVQITDESKCVGCLLCELKCPDFAIAIEENEDTNPEIDMGKQEGE